MTVAFGPVSEFAIVPPIEFPASRGRKPRPSSRDILRIPLLTSRIRWLGVLTVAGLILYWSLPAAPPPDPIAPTPTSATEGTPDLLPLPTWRHFLAYCALGLSLSYAIADRSASPYRRAMIVFLAATGYGAVIELGQALVPHRSAHLADVVTNALGVAMSLIWYGLEPRLRFVRLPQYDVPSRFGSS